jgi:hypothetical protein
VDEVGREVGDALVALLQGTGEYIRRGARALGGKAGMGRNADGQRKDEPSSGRVLHGSTGQAGDSYDISFRRPARPMA